MTTATEFNLKQFLSKQLDFHGSGFLRLNAELVYWEIYLDRGNVQYVRGPAQTVDRLKYHLQHLGLKEVVAAVDKIKISDSWSKTSDRQQSFDEGFFSKAISQLIAEDRINTSQVAQLLDNINKEEIQLCSWLDSTDCHWYEGHLMPSWIPKSVRELLSKSVSEYLTEAETTLKKWQKCSRAIKSVHQRPYFPPNWETKSLPVKGSLNHNTLMELTKILRGRTTIRQLSTLLKKEEIQVAQILSPYIDEKIIYLHHAPTPLNQLPSIPQNNLQNLVNNLQPTKAQNAKTKVWKIVCIDDSPTILSEIQRFLGKEGFAVTAIEDPVQAVSKIFKLEPDLILLDITMPKINGYKLCGLLRNSGKCDDTPIIMVTGNTGLIDKARAKLAGATDYFTKPFTKEGLNKIVGKYLPQ
ncbi:MAG: response regulator [Cyanobacteria bacterium P01_A01_bin.83]